MAKRPCYRPLDKYVGYNTVESPEFKWNPGFAYSQKQKNGVAVSPFCPLERNLRLYLILR